MVMRAGPARQTLNERRGFITIRASISTSGKAASGAEGGEWWRLAAAENLEGGALHLPERLG